MNELQSASGLEATPLDILIIDDDAPSVRVLKRNLLKYPGVSVRTAASLAEGEKEIAEAAPDAIFLDMEFPDANGLEWYENASLPLRTRVIFYTCWQRYIHDALSGKVFDFLLKPFDSEELGIILHRLRDAMSARIPETITVATPIVTRPAKSIAITTITNDKVIAGPNEILFFRYDSERKLWECVLTSLRRFILKRQSTAETILNYGSDFVRTHKKYILNVNYLAIISGSDCILLPPYDTITEIKISKSYRRELLDRFYDI